MSTTLIIILLVVIYIISVFGGIEMLIYTKEKTTNPDSGVVFIPLLNTIMTILVLGSKLIDIVTNYVNHRIDYNERNKFKNERL
jgi:flagellar basal body-associated protein FliL